MPNVSTILRSEQTSLMAILHKKKIFCCLASSKVLELFKQHVLLPSESLPCVLSIIFLAFATVLPDLKRKQRVLSYTDHVCRHFSLLFFTQRSTNEHRMLDTIKWISTMNCLFVQFRISSWGWSEQNKNNLTVYLLSFFAFPWGKYYFFGCNNCNESDSHWVLVLVPNNNNKKTFIFRLCRSL